MFHQLRMCNLNIQLRPFLRDTADILERSVGTRRRRLEKSEIFLVPPPTNSEQVQGTSRVCWVRNREDKAFESNQQPKTSTFDSSLRNAKKDRSILQGSSAPRRTGRLNPHFYKMQIMFINEMEGYLWILVRITVFSDFVASPIAAVTENFDCSDVEKRKVLRGLKRISRPLRQTDRVPTATPERT
ncbi:hypothetical protein WG66_002603 [Moniliophthora roreri]|nr:hypothetical protein WG66_002603 [Moniliophthora roreri]